MPLSCLGNSVSPVSLLRRLTLEEMTHRQLQEPLGWGLKDPETVKQMSMDHLSLLVAIESPGCKEAYAGGRQEGEVGPFAYRMRPPKMEGRFQEV